MSPRPPADSESRRLTVAIVGNDAVLTALPSRTMQLAHALHACGFDFVVPVSWGEELVAREVLRVMATRDASPAIFCACPLQRARLLASGSELAPFLVSLASPTVATARYLRALHQSVPLHITAIGGCPDEPDPSIDVRIASLELHALLDAHGVLLAEQPDIFESVIPPDRRRYFSLPGGCPTPRMLELRVPERQVVTITDAAFADELGDVLLGGESVLVDLSPRLACVCCGGFVAGAGVGGGGRDLILRQEPPRALSSLLEHGVVVDLSPEPPDPGTRHRSRWPGDDAPRDVGRSTYLPPDSDAWRGGATDLPTQMESSATIDAAGEPVPMSPATPPAGQRAVIDRPRIAVTPAGAVRGAAARRRGTSPPPSPSGATHAATLGGDLRGNAAWERDAVGHASRTGVDRGGRRRARARRARSAERGAEDCSRSRRSAASGGGRRGPHRGTCAAHRRACDRGGGGSSDRREASTARPGASVARQ